MSCGIFLSPMLCEDVQNEAQKKIIDFGCETDPKKNTQVRLKEKIAEKDQRIKQPSDLIS